MSKTGTSAVGHQEDGNDLSKARNHFPICKLIEDSSNKFWIRIMNPFEFLIASYLSLEEAFTVSDYSVLGLKWKLKHELEVNNTQILSMIWLMKILIFAR
jgi:hypothetical protein